MSGRAPHGLFFELGLRPSASPLARYRPGDVVIPGISEPLLLQEREGFQLRDRPGAMPGVLQARAIAHLGEARARRREVFGLG